MQPSAEARTRHEVLETVHKTEQLSWEAYSRAHDMARWTRGAPERLLRIIASAREEERRNVEDIDKQIQRLHV